ncbi:lipopolysaccharide/colanic/teichoic acid biosynthesis glycosyltransferase [Ulvibacter sp. MAR_2010_11]|uniref:sugar transferase n=1 Tax=Ulvibacter sp. MAR_2010_11 TaxID=1250229 RepID=UPI000C2C7E64|nr:sugar transferase [Ulvibacter sp. MAR_2010_11]PKA82145.1 lipopolysaccharide/colanic/teichoic acid biosynthesis glycosyltransferase [Ulvibacter sp. MAR_2010_11]
MLTRRQLVLKRIFDLSFSILILPFAIIPLILLTVLATLSTGSNGFFVQQRIGQHGKPFALYKIRSLKGSHHVDVLEIKQSETKFGSWLRRTKLDELPQVFNVLLGDMSWVGPRPDISGYADKLEGDDKIILSIKPGITGPATLTYRNEDNLLVQQSNPKEYNDIVIWPDKVAINKAYIQNWSLVGDVKYIIRSVFGSSW